MNKTVIALTGYAKVGKDTFADHILKMGKENNNPGLKIDLVQRLKAGVSHLYGVPLMWFTDQSLKDTPIKNTKGTSICSSIVGKTPRFLLQDMGQYVVEHIDKHYWIRCGCEEIKYTKKNLCVIAGVRKNSEVSFLKGFYPQAALIHLTRDNIHAINNHPTEFPISKEFIDYEINMPDLFTEEYEDIIKQIYEEVVLKVK